MTAPAMAAPASAPARAAPAVQVLALRVLRLIALELLEMAPGHRDPRHNDAAVWLRHVLKPHVEWLQTQDTGREHTELDIAFVRALRFIDEVVLNSTQ